jgi:TolA-binding protein
MTMKMRILIGCWLLGGALPAPALEPGEQMQFADGLYARGMYDMAAREYRRLVEEAPGFENLDAVFYRLAECSRQLGDKKAADEFYRRLVADYPQSGFRSKAGLREAELLVAAARYADAVPALRQLLDQNPPPDIAAPAGYYLGYSLKRLPAAADAAAAFQDVLARHPDSPFAGFAGLELAEIHLQSDGGQDKARAIYEQVLKKPASPRVAAEASFQLAELAYRARDYPASAGAYQRLLKEFPDDRRVGEAMLQAAWSFYQAEQYPDALALADRALRDEGQGQEAAWLYLKANTVRQLGKGEQSAAIYDRLLKKFPHGPLATAAAYERALLSFREGNYEQVIEQFRQTAPTAVTEQDLNWLLAESYAAMGQRTNALAHYRVIAERFPDGERAAAALFRVGALEQEEGRSPEAAAAYQRVVEKYPKHELAPDALFSAAAVLAHTRKYSDARKLWTRLLKEYPDYARTDETLYQKALTEIQADDRAAALQSLARLVKEFQASVHRADAFHWRGILFEQQGKAAEAERDLRAALEAKPSDELARKIRFRLATVLQKQDKLEESAALLQGLLAAGVASNMPPALLEWLAHFHLDRNAFEPAAEAARALESVSSGADWKQIAWFLIGSAEAGRGQAAPARAAFEKALQQDARTREGAEAALRLGQLALDEKRYDDAETFYQRGGELAQSSEVLDVRARSYYGLGMTARARARWDEASRYFLGMAILFDDPELTPECLYRAAEALVMLDRIPDLEKTLAELRQRYPDSPWIEKLPDLANLKPKT